MDVSVFGSLIITYAVVQTVVFLLLMRFVDLYEREPISVLALMALWGAIGATSISAVGNVALEQVLPQRIDVVFGNAIYAPIVEELAKGAALVVFVAISFAARGRYGIPHFEGVTDGIVYGAAVGLGFAFTEDILYLLLGASDAGLREGLVSYLSRRDFFGLAMLHHAIYTGAFGVGLGLATWSRNRWARIGFPALGLFAAMFLHAVNNGFVQLMLVVRYGIDNTQFFRAGLLQGALQQDMQKTVADASGIVRFLDFVVVIAFLIMIQLWLRYQRKIIRAELAEEAETGLISREELDLMPSYWRRTQWYLQLLRTGQWERLRILRRIHNELVEFALLKRRSKRAGRADVGRIDKSRQLITKLKAQKVVFL